MAYSIHVPANSNNISTSVIELRGDTGTVLTITTDGMIKTSAGDIHVNDWIMVTKVMKQLIVDMSKDTILASKYPYVEEAAHRWLIDELRK